LAIILGVLAAALYFWEITLWFAREFDAAFKLVGLVIGPFLAVLGFFWGLVDKAELKDLTEALGRAREEAESERRLVDTKQAELDAKVEQIKSLEHNLATIVDARQLWKLRNNAPFSEYRGWKYDPRGAKIVTIALFKGGVAKTHLAANFAAYISETQRKRVLLIDLDYQGSLSTMMLMAAGVDPVGSHVDSLFDENADLALLSEKRIHLASRGPGTALSGGQGLARAWIVPADYTLTQVESRLLIDRVIHHRQALDERYRLAHLLLHPHVRREYEIILIDTPPRMTVGTVNALVASHFYVIPAILDRVSSEAVKPFLTQVETLKRDLEVDVRLAGIVGTMTRQLPLSDTEKRYRDQIIRTAMEVLGTDESCMIEQNLPRKTQVTDQDDLGYFLRDSEGPLRDRFYDAIFNELWKRIMCASDSC